MRNTEATLGLFVIAIFSYAVEGLTVKEELKAIDVKNMGPYAALHGMNLTTVRVVTRDGWILQVHRIQNPDVYDAKHSSPVLLAHGLGCSSFEYMANPRNESMAFLLADRGYDVWAVNFRGNRFSNKMVNVRGSECPPTEKDFYRATWQYMAERDIPAIMDTILKVTGISRVYLIGQSMGTTALFSFLSENHAYDDKIGHFAAITPVIRFGSDTDATLKIPFTAATKIPGLIPWFMYPRVFGQDLADTGSGLNVFKSFVCKVFKTVCDLFMGILFNVDKLDIFNDKHLNKARLPLYVNLYPTGMALMNMYQFARQFKRDPWEKMDYREVSQTKITNQQEYGQSSPPKYNFAAVNVSMSLDFSNNDIFTGLDTAEKLIVELKLSREFVRVHDCNSMNHHETMLGWDARCCIYDSILDRFERIERAQNQADLDAYRNRVADYVANVLGDNNEICINLRADPAYDP